MSQGLQNLRMPFYNTQMRYHQRLTDVELRKSELLSLLVNVRGGFEPYPMRMTKSNESLHDMYEEAMPCYECPG